MSKMKKSQIVFSIFFMFWGYFIFSYPVICYGQPHEKFEKKERQIFVEKPRTIRLKPGRKIASASASDNEQKLYVSERDGLLYCFDLETAGQLWTADLGGKTVSNLLETENLLYIVTSRENNSGIKTDVKTKNGSDIKIDDPEKKFFSKENVGSSVLWAIDKKSGITAFRAVVFGDLNFHLFKSGEVIYLIDGSRMSVSVFGESLKRSAEETVFDKKLAGQPFFDRETKDLYLVFEDEVLKMALKKERVVYERIIKAVGKNRINAFTVSGELYFVGDEMGNLSAYKKSDKTQMWKFRAGGKISDIEIFADKLIVSSFDNFLYCLKSGNGKQIWKKRFPGRISKVNKSTDMDLFVRSSYSADYYLIDVGSGNIANQYLVKLSDAGAHISLQTTTGLIMIVKIDSIDIYKKN